MRPEVIVLTLLVGFLTSSSSVTDAGEMPAHVKATLGKIVGDWTMETEVDGKKRSSDFSIKWTINETVLIFTWSGIDAVTGEKASSTGILGWDAVRKLVVEHEVTSTGATYDGTHHIFEDGTWLSPYRGSGLVDGKAVFSETCRTIEIVSKDEWTVSGGDWSSGKAPQPDGKTILRRKC